MPPDVKKKSLPSKPRQAIHDSLGKSYDATYKLERRILLDAAAPALLAESLIDEGGLSPSAQTASVDSLIKQGTNEGQAETPEIDTGKEGHSEAYQDARKSQLSTQQDNPLNIDVRNDEGLLLGPQDIKLGPSHGNVVLNAAGTLEYRPQANYSGSDTILFDLGPETAKDLLLEITIEPAISQENQTTLDTLLSNDSPITEVIFVDKAINDYQGFIDGIDEQAAVFSLESDSDGLTQMVSILKSLSLDPDFEGLNGLHIISHGSEAQLELGNIQLTQESMLEEHADELVSIGRYLNAEADILVYGCNFSFDEQGLDAVETLSELTGADIAASNDLTGHLSLGGDWALEVNQGVIETSSIANHSWQGVLIPFITSGPNAGPIDENSPANQLVYTVSYTSNPSSFVSLSGSDAGSFFLSGPNVFINHSPDFETKPFYSFVVVVQDLTVGFNPGGFDNQVVTLNINNIGDTTVSVSGGDLQITDNNGATDDTLTVSVSGLYYRIEDPNNILDAGSGVTRIDDHTVDVLIASVTGSIVVDTLGGDDNLTIDYTGGAISHAINYNGGTQDSVGDSLSLSNGTFDTTTYNFTNENDGMVNITGNGLITYTGLEPITSTINATNVILDYSAAAETIDISDAGSGQTTVDSTAGEVVTFNNPSSAITINAGGGNDTINLNSLDSSWTGTLSIDGEGGNDTTVIDQSFNTSAGLTLESDNTINEAGGDVGSISTGNLTLQKTSAYTFEFGGTAAGDLNNNYEQISVTGAVSFNSGNNLNLVTAAVGSFTPSAGDSFVIISNDGTDAVSGDFSNAAEGSTLTNFLGSGLDATITYQGGDGNDVVISLPNTDTDPPVFTSGTTAADINENSGANQLIYTVVATDASTPLVYSIDAVLDGAAFDIDSGTGEVRLIAIPDYETKSSYSFRVTATDTAGNSATQTVTLAINNLDEVPPVFDLLSSTVEINDTTTNGPASSVNNFGLASSTLGDFNNDGIPDLAVGALTPEGGLVYLFQMKRDGSIDSKSEINFQTTGGPMINNGDFFGGAIANIGDLDGNGFIDLAIGASGDDDGGNNQGAVHIVFMKAGGMVDSTVSINSVTHTGLGLSNNDGFGRSVAALGDLDGMGSSVTALAVGADEAAGGGSVHILYLNSDGSVMSSTVINSGTAGGPTITGGDDFGDSIANIGDLNNDGVNDIAVGADLNDAGGNARGALHIIFLNSNGSVDGFFTINSVTSPGITLNNNDEFGSSVTNLGDIDGDSIVDLAVGADGDNTGVVHLLLMNSDGTVKSTEEINNEITNGPVISTNDIFGHSVLNIGDLDDNGVNDLAVGAVNDGIGTVHIIFRLNKYFAPAINENSGAGQAVYTAQATDPASDGGPSNPVTFSFGGGTDDALFSIVVGTGVVTLTGNPDHETKSSYSFDVTATDGAGNSVTQTARAFHEYFMVITV